MKATEILTEGLEKKQTYSILHDFVRFAAEHLELKKLPKFDFIFDSRTSVEFVALAQGGLRRVEA